jgi:hypothetical protein
MMHHKGYKISPTSHFWGHSKQGEITNIKRSEINRILGFSGNFATTGKCNNKPSKAWYFTLEDENGAIHLCAIWDYYATGQWYSVWMPRKAAECLFGDRYEHQSDNYRQITRNSL